jgi:hypothetical protein
MIHMVNSLLINLIYVSVSGNSDPLYHVAVALYDFERPEKRTFQPIAFPPEILYNINIEMILEIRPYHTRADLFIDRGGSFP